MPPQLVFVFSGQGNQWPGLGRSLLAAGSAGAGVIAECDQAIRSLAGWSIKQALTEADADQLSDPAVLQPSLVALQLGLAAEAVAIGLTPTGCVGHSLGEVAAAAVAGALTPAEAMRLAELRGRLMRELTGTGRTALVDLDADRAAELIERHGGQASVAAWNSPHATVIAGQDATVRPLVAELTAAGVFARELPGTVAFHSRWVEPILAQFTAALTDFDRTGSAGPTIDFHSTATGEISRTAALDAAYWSDNIRQPVQFRPVIEALLGRGVRHFLELGAHPTLLPALLECAAGIGAELTVAAGLRRDGDAIRQLRLAGHELARAGVVRTGLQPRFWQWSKQDGMPAPGWAGQAEQLSQAVGGRALRITWQPIGRRPDVSTLALPRADRNGALLFGRDRRGRYHLRAEAFAIAAEPVTNGSSLPDKAELGTSDVRLGGGPLRHGWRTAGSAVFELRPRRQPGRTDLLRCCFIALGKLDPAPPAGLRLTLTDGDPAQATWLRAELVGDGAVGGRPRAIEVLTATGQCLVRLDELVLAEPITSDRTVETGSSRFDPAALFDLDPTLRLDRLTRYVAEQVAEVMRLPVARLPVTEPVNALGLDSIMGLEIRRRLESSLGVELSVVTMLRGASVTGLAEGLLDQLAPRPALSLVADAESPCQTSPDDVAELLDDLDGLSADEVEALLARFGETPMAGGR